MAKVDRGVMLEPDEHFVDCKYLLWRFSELTRIICLIAIQTEERGLFAAIKNHSFRDENKEKERNISPKRFHLNNKFLNQKERIEKAEKEAKIMLSTGEKLS